eukprot:NODE_3275_length_808_cov_377.286853.p2 GENE.NODE_3275_length_808_cov_377.286853~~NODE_3275_length_808_cov_377.286853.p2  ORF type:complete len:163 (+),score=31.09 NODE_3275_length_808_cov_377.286853:3-491(+)
MGLDLKSLAMSAKVCIDNSTKVPQCVVMQRRFLGPECGSTLPEPSAACASEVPLMPMGTRREHDFTLLPPEYKCSLMCAPQACTSVEASESDAHLPPAAVMRLPSPGTAMCSQPAAPSQLRGARQAACAHDARAGHSQGSGGGGSGSSGLDATNGLMVNLSV